MLGRHRLQRSRALPCEQLCGRHARQLQRIVQINDATLIKRAVLGLGPGLASPQKCNVIGGVDLADPDQNGVPADCLINDSTVVKRGVLALGPGVAQVCAPAVL